MDPESFRGSPAGRLVRIPPAHWAFVPAPLPPALDFDLTLVRRLSRADRALGELAGIGSTLPNPHLLIRPFLRREAVLSSRIEGTQTSLEELFTYEAEQLPLFPRTTPTARTADTREVFNYVVALEYGLKRLDQLPLSRRLLLELHERLMADVRGGDKRPGQFRYVQNYVSGDGSGIEHARYVPPPVEEMHPALDAFERFLHEPLTLPLLVWLALVHYQFEAIHPFRDGNGRLGRLLIILLLCERRWLPQPLLYLSAYFERHRQAYYDHLLAVSQRGAWREWVLFFLDAVTEQARDAVRRSQRLLSLQQHYRSRLQQERFPLASLHLVDALFSTPALTITQAARLLDVSFPAASQNIERLAAAGMLREVTGRPRNRVYLATEILRVLEEQLAPGEPEDDAIE